MIHVHVETRMAISLDNFSTSPSSTAANMWIYVLKEREEEEKKQRMKEEHQLHQGSPHL